MSKVNMVVYAWYQYRYGTSSTQKPEFVSVGFVLSNKLGHHINTVIYHIRACYVTFSKSSIKSDSGCFIISSSLVSMVKML